MGMIIDADENLRFGLEARRESFVVYANEWVANQDHIFLSTATIDGKTSSVAIEAEYDQLDLLIEGLIKLREYVVKDGRVKNK